MEYHAFEEMNTGGNYEDRAWHGQDFCDRCGSYEFKIDDGKVVCRNCLKVHSETTRKAPADA